MRVFASSSAVQPPMVVTATALTHLDTRSAALNATTVLSLKGGIVHIYIYIRAEPGPPYILSSFCHALPEPTKVHVDK